MDEAEAEDATEGAMSRNPRTKGASGTALPAKQGDAAGTSQHSHLEKKKKSKKKGDEKGNGDVSLQATQGVQKTATTAVEEHVTHGGGDRRD